MDRDAAEPNASFAMPAASGALGSQLFLAFGAILMAIYFLLPPERQIVFYDVFGISAFAAILVGVWRNRPAARSPWIVVALGLLSLVGGDVVLNRYYQIFHASPSFPSVCDILFTGGTLLAAVGIALMLRRRLADQDRGTFIDAMIVATALGVLSWIFLMVPYVRDPSLTNLQKIVSIAYPCEDVLAVALLARLILGGGHRAASYWLISLAVVCVTASDVVFAELTLRTGEAPPRGHWVDVGWLLWYIFIGAAGLHPSMRTITETGPATPPILTGRRLAVLTLFACLVPAAGLIEAVHHNQTSGAIIAVGSGVLFLLVLWRLRGLVRAVQHARDNLEAAVQRERALRQSAARLVAANDRQEIYATARQAVRELAGDGAMLRIAEGDADHLTVVDAGEAHGHALSIPSALVTQLADSRLAVIDPDRAEHARAALKLPADGSILLSPLVIEDEIRGALLVALPGVATTKEHAWLEALGSQLALALERMTLAERLHARRSEERFRSLVRNASDIIVICDVDSTVRYVSPSIERILGYSPDEIVGTSSLAHIHPEDVAEVEQTQNAVIAAPGMTRATEYRIGHRNRTWHHVEAIKTNLLHDESIRGLVINIRDITERKQAEELLTYQAFHDPLTDLPNRALFMDRLNHSLVRAARREESTGIVFLDIDRFKVVNDSLGHESGDHLLKAAAHRIKLGLRDGDTASRLGGDEFTILLEGIVDATDAISVAERLRAEFEQPFAIEGREVFVSVSMGITISRPGHQDAMDLLREADIAMYQAKGAGNGGFAVFDADMGAAALRRLELETNLRRAVERNEFELYYQPTVDLATSNVVAMEGLLRWRQSDRGIVAPGEFIPLAEETGLIVPIGLWVLQEACQQAAAWREQFGIYAPTISVNLSARQLVHDTIVADVEETIRAAGIDPAMITLEITETVAVDDAERCRFTLERLKEVGVRLAIDDFGSGYSSLGYLRQLPVDVLKIDRGFVQALANNPGDTLIISSVSSIAHSRGMVVVAEGVEEAAQVERVRELGCDLGQGFFWAKPLPAQLATAYLELDLHSVSAGMAAAAAD